MALSDLSDKSAERLDLTSFSQLVQELINGAVRRHTFSPWELELLLDLQTCRARKSARAELLRRYLYSTPQQKRRHRWSDRLFVAFVLLVVVAVIVASIGVMLLILTWLGRAIFG